MAFSVRYITKLSRAIAPKGSANCDLSDILQRDLLLGVDYTDDPDSWLFAWDDLNPDCQISDKSQANGNIQGTDRGDYTDGRYGLGKDLGNWLCTHLNHVLPFLFYVANFSKSSAFFASLRIFLLNFLYVPL